MEQHRPMTLRALEKAERKAQVLSDKWEEDAMLELSLEQVRHRERYLRPEQVERLCVKKGIVIESGGIVSTPWSGGGTETTPWPPRLGAQKQHWQQHESYHGLHHNGPFTLCDSAAPEEQHSAGNSNNDDDDSNSTWISMARELGLDIDTPPPPSHTTTLAQISRLDVDALLTATTSGMCDAINTTGHGRYTLLPNYEGYPSPSPSSEENSSPAIVVHEVDLQEFIQEILQHSVCLGPTPGIKRVHLESAIERMLRRARASARSGVPRGREAV
ncbi:hypothetical protein BDZ91DRAFT_728765, partial [Kalaharituber pfeilii]